MVDARLYPSCFQTTSCRGYNPNFCRWIILFHRYSILQNGKAEISSSCMAPFCNRRKRIAFYSNFQVLDPMEQIMDSMAGPLFFISLFSHRPNEIYSDLICSFQKIFAKIPLSIKTALLLQKLLIVNSNFLRIFPFSLT